MDQDSKSTETAWPKAGAQDDLLVSQSGHLVPRRQTDLPAVIRKPIRRVALRLRAFVALAIILAGAVGAYYWWQRLHPPLPSGIAYGNGRLEADEINIDTKYAARIAEILADQGTLVKAGQVVARMDTRDLQASLKRAQAQTEQARRAVDEANANLTQMESQVLLAQQELDRATLLGGIERALGLDYAGLCGIRKRSGAVELLLPLIECFFGLETFLHEHCGGSLCNAAGHSTAGSVFT